MEILALDDLIAHIPDGSKLAVAKDDTGVAMAATVALVRRGVRDLHLVCLPVSGLQADLLIAAGCLATIETSAVTFGEHGSAPHFVRALRDGGLRILDGTCPAIHAGMQASQKGIPFMPLRGILDSDLLGNRNDWTIIDNPFRDESTKHNDPIVLIKAIDPDIALFHAASADRFGNVFIGRERECLTLAHAARQCLVTVERIEEGNLLDDPARSGSVIPAIYITAIAHVPLGAWPIGFGDEYRADERAIRSYLRHATEESEADALLEELLESSPWSYGPGVAMSR